MLKIIKMVRISLCMTKNYHNFQNIFNIFIILNIIFLKKSIILVTKKKKKQMFHTDKEGKVSHNFELSYRKYRLFFIIIDLKLFIII